MFALLPESWIGILAPVKHHFDTLDREITWTDVCPDKADVFRPLIHLNPSEVKIIVLGQDPYHKKILNRPIANGVAFASSMPTYTPPSLRNIFKELGAEYPGTRVPSNDLLHWVNQGVLLINVHMTTKKGVALAHGKGAIGAAWKAITKQIITHFDDKIFLLWGKKAQLHAPVGATVVACAHPSPLSARRGFFGSRCFIKVNELLRERGQEEISWTH